jgi:hypothetical protein
MAVTFLLRLTLTLAISRALPRVSLRYDTIAFCAGLAVGLHLWHLISAQEGAFAFLLMLRQLWYRRRASAAKRMPGSLAS